MAKLGEINYLRNLNDRGRRHAVNKPFSDRNCSRYFVEFGAIMTLLPPPPARLLDIGCGTGWTSRFFARRGYDVLGIDICSDMIEAAQELNDHEQLPNLQFRVCDYETSDLGHEFDIAVFYDALHHAVDEQAAVNAAFRALKPSGVCITSEPGRGHARSQQSQHAMARFDVTEKDMPPSKIIAMGRKAGFRKFQVYPHAFDMAKATYERSARLAQIIPRWLKPVRAMLGLFMVGGIYLVRPFSSGIVVLNK